MSSPTSVVRGFARDGIRVRFDSTKARDDSEMRTMHGLLICIGRRASVFAARRVTLTSELVARFSVHIRK